MDDKKVIKLPMGAARKQWNFNRNSPDFGEMNQAPEMQAFTPFNTVFGEYNHSEKDHIHALITRYKILLKNKHDLKSQPKKELDALRWVLEFLKEEIEHVD